jgi:6-phosphogluconate dehydrogenase
MKLGFVGLGKMGANMVERLLRDGHEVVVYNRSPEPVALAVSKGATAAQSLKDLVSKLPGRKVVWLMVPAGNPVDENIGKLLELLQPDDIIIDGGNSNYKDSQARAKRTKGNKIHYLDCGTSGGIWGLANGYSLMSGGDQEASEYVYPIYRSLAPEGGYTYCGESGAGHFVKMIHNGIEYGMMQSYAEGIEIMEKSPFKLDLAAITSGWQYGSVVRSWLLELLVVAFKADPKLEGISDYVPDSGEGRWTVEAAIEFDVPAPVITTSLYSRFRSRQEESFAMKVLAALRNRFGGHDIVKK